VHNFLWDRTRAIRNDFSIQQLSKAPDLRIAIECLERIARFHILSLHQIGGKPAPHPADYNWQQDREQLDKTLLSLMQFYSKARDGYRSKNEAEFRAYSIIFQIQNPIADLEDRMHDWPRELYTDPRVLTAVKIYTAASDFASLRGPLQPAARQPWAKQNFDRFWKLISSKQVSYLMACVAEIQFNHVRRGILRAVWQSYRPGGPNTIQDWTLKDLSRALRFPKEADTQNFVQQHGFTVGTRADGTRFWDLTSIVGRQFPAPIAPLPDQTFSHDPVEKKRYGRTFSAVIDGTAIKDAQRDEPMSEAEEEESLFVSDEEDTSSTPAAPVNPFASTMISSIQSDSRGFGQASLPSTVANTQSSPGIFGQASLPTTILQPQNSFGIFGQASSSVQGTSAPSNNTFTPTSTTPVKSFGGFGQPSSTLPHSAPLANPFASSSILSTEEASTNESKQSVKPLEPPISVSEPSPLSAAPNFPGTYAPKLDFKAIETATPMQAPQPFSLASTPPASSAAPITNTPFQFSGSLLPKPVEAQTPMPAKLEASQTPSFPTSIPPTSRPSFEAPQFQFSTSPSSQSLSYTPFSTPAKPPVSEPFHFASPKPLSAPTFQHEDEVRDPKHTSMSSVNSLHAQKGKAAKQVEETRRKESMDFISRQVLLDSKIGLLREYIVHAAGPIIEQSLEDDKVERAQQVADEFRYFVLARRWFTLWRENARIRRLRRQGLEKKKRLAAEAEAHRRRMKEKEAQTQVKLQQVGDEFDKFRASMTNKRGAIQPVLDFGYGDIGQPNALHAATGGTDLTSNKAESSVTGRQGRPSVRSHKRSQTQPTIPVAAAPKNASFRVSKSSKSPTRVPSILSVSDRQAMFASSAFTGASVLDLAGLPVGTKVSTMTSNYFKLKALGIELPSDKRFPLTTQSKKRLHREDDDDHRPERKKLFSPPRASPFSSPLANGSSKMHNTWVSQSPLQKESSPQRILRVSESPTASFKLSQSLRPEDEALFVEAHKLMQKLDEGEAFYREEIGREELRRSQTSGSPPNGASPPGPQHQLQSSTASANNLPKFYSRPSRFLKPEEYGKRREPKKNTTPTSGQKGKGRADGSGSFQMNGFMNGNGSRNNNMAAPPQSSRRQPPPSRQDSDRTGASVEDAIEL
jgi:hypothetical protein